VVNSPSHDTVRQPVHRQAIGRWRHYARHIEPYLDRLQPFVDVFGYR
jgi:hypothetical protein